MTQPQFTILHHLDTDPVEKPTPQVYAEALEQVIVADEVGIDTVWFAEHHGGLEAGRLPAPLLFIIKAAEHTRRVTLGTGVTLLPFYHPLQVAEQVAEADIITGGRFALGIGAGFAPGDFAAFGVAPASKRDRLREGLDILQQAWAGETFSYHGEHYHIEKGRLAPTPPRPWRDLVWLAASHTDTAQMAGERDMHLMLSRGNPVSLSQTLIATYQASLRQAGHRTDDRFTQKTWMVYVSDSEADALAMGERGARGYYEHTLRLGRPRVPNDDDLNVCLAHVDMLIGTPEQVADELARQALELGLTHIALHTRFPQIPHARLLRSTELLGRVVLPRVREAYAGALVPA